MVYVVDRPGDISAKLTGTDKAEVYETNEGRVSIEIAGSGWNSSSILYLRAGGLTRVAKGDDVGTGATPEGKILRKVTLDLPRGLRPEQYPVQVSADGGMTFFPVDKDLSLEVKACPAGSSCTSKEPTACLDGYSVLREVW